MGYAVGEADQSVAVALLPVPLLFAICSLLCAVGEADQSVAVALLVVPLLFAICSMLCAVGEADTGAPGATRTLDSRFRKPVLYPLSYRGT